MNVVLIPFFLAANVVVNDTSKWTFGAKYSYDLNMTYMIKTDPHEPVETMTLISKLNCRPKSADNLFCHLQNSTIVNFGRNPNTTREVETEQMFEIKFSERGVEGLTIEPPSRMEVVNILRKIANQFSIGVDWRKIERISQFMARENSSMGNCATVYRIRRGELKTNTIGDEQVDDDFRFIASTMLADDDAKPITNLLIEKSRMGCINPPRYVDFSSGILKMGRFVTKIQINNKFEVSTEFDGKIRPPIDSMNRMLSFKEIMQLNLKSIDPAEGEIPPISYGESIDLNISTDIPSNFIN
ncbi:uncharacterized protein LOC114936688 [Nylanderia fulva]|uniref:uncharacterized protein LOC114936688 n=1 Tax=Nylanderia fulva TaxID=613905 RepID=UPI0010FAD6E2|nr:uncharacterized protein LOC114936688 [Nylanderia fulva]